MMIKEKNLSIELLKFFAVIFVLNSHMDTLYAKYSVLATGGAIGDCLFFFASGFTLFLGRFGRFDNWYKRRIKRIYPPIIAWACIMPILFTKQMSVIQLINGGGYWFIKCILLHYIILYFMRYYYSEKPLIPFAICSCVVLIWYCFEDSSKMFMYHVTYFKWVHYFLFMLAGAYVGNKTIKFTSKPKTDSITLALSFILFYGIKIMAGRSVLIAHLQIFSLVPLMGIIIYTYKLCCSPSAVRLITSKSGKGLRFIASLCLEAYLVQSVIIHNKSLSEFLKPIFPLNLLITFIIVIVVAYLVRCLGRMISQVFEKEDMDWKAVGSLVD